MNNAGGTRRWIKLAAAGMLVATGLLAAPATTAHAIPVSFGQVNSAVIGEARGNVGAGQVAIGSADAASLASQQAAMEAARAKVEAQSALLAAQARANGNIQAAAASVVPAAITASAARGAVVR